jgi:hypothetical protein
LVRNPLWQICRVSNLDEQATDLERCGIDAGKRATSDMVKTLMIADPDGNHIAEVVSLF